MQKYKAKKQTQKPASMPRTHKDTRTIADLCCMFKCRPTGPWVFVFCFLCFAPQIHRIFQLIELPE